MEYDKILTDILGRKDFLVVGKSVIRTDALDKALGRAKYTADYVPKGTTILKVYRSTVAHANIKSIDTSEALKVPGVEAIYTGADVTGNNQIGYALPDQPFLNDKKVHYVGDPIALICAKDEYAAMEAMDKIHVDYEELPAHLDIDAALVEGAEDIHDGGNIALVTTIRKGDIAGVFESADAVVEDTYWSPYQDHTYIETEAAYAIPGESKVTVIANGQSPFLCREKVAHVLGWDLNQVQIIQALTGGAFGGKDDQGPLLCAYAAFASLKLRKPVVHIWNREESLAYSNKRFPARIHYKSACTKDGKVTGIEVKITLECGAYANRSPFWLWRQTAHAGGPYEIDNCWIDGKGPCCVHTQRSHH